MRSARGLLSFALLAVKTRIEIDRLVKRSPAFLSAAFCWAFYVACLARAVFSDAMAAHLFNSDTLTYYLIAEDVIRDAPFDWALSTNFYVFPDAVLYFIFHFLCGGDFRLALPATAFALGVIGICGWICLSRWATRGKSADCAVLVCGGVLFLLADYSAADLVSDDGWVYMWSDIVWSSLYLITPVAHGGAFSMTLFCFLLFLQCEESHFRRAHLLVALLALAALTYASDHLFLVWFIAPAALLLVWREHFRFRRMKRGFLLLIAVFLLGSVLREMIDAYLFSQPAGVSDNFRPTRLFSLPERFVDYLAVYFSRQPMGLLLWLASVALLVYFVGKSRSPDRARLVAGVVLSAMICALLASIVSGKMHVRWQLPFWFAPQFVVSFLLINRAAEIFFTRPLKWRLILLSALPLVAAVFVAPGRADIHRLIHYRPQMQDCLDENAKRHGLRQGLASYWIAKRGSAFSRADFRMVSVRPDFDYFDWIENRRKAQGDGFNFVLIFTKDLYDGSDADDFIGQDPVARFDCGSIEGRVYSPFSYSELLSERLLRPVDGATPPGAVSPSLPSDVNQAENVGRDWLMRMLHKHKKGLSAAAVDAALDAGAKLDARDWAGRSALHYAGRYGGREVVAALIQAGANVNAEDFLDRTPLHRAATKNFDAVSALLNNGATIEARNILNETPLHAAARNLNCDSIRALVAAGADRDAKDWLGRTPRDLAFSSLSEKPWLREHFISLCGFDSPIGETALADRIKERNSKRNVFGSQSFLESLHSLAPLGAI